MSRLDLTRVLIEQIDEDTAVIAGIGNTNFDLFAAGHRATNFYMLGSMGLAVPIALGIAMAQPERQVIALEGDGSILMNLGTLTTVAARNPENLTIVIWDNRLYQITGNQATATASGADIVAIASGAGIASSRWAEDSGHFARLIRNAREASGPHLVAARVDASPGAARPERNPVVLKERFMAGLISRSGTGS